MLKTADTLLPQHVHSNRLKVWKPTCIEEDASWILDDGHSLCRPSVRQELMSREDSHWKAKDYEWNPHTLQATRSQPRGAEERPDNGENHACKKPEKVFGWPSIIYTARK